MRWLLVVLAGITSLAQAVVIRDDRQVEVTIAKPPQRIVSLLPSLTETVCALGQCQKLVGVDRYSNWPDRIAKLPRMGGGLDPTIESVVAAKPDLVLMATSGRGAERFTALGLTVLALEPRSHADVQRVMRTVAQALDVSVQESDRVWRDIDTAVNAAAQSIPEHAKGQRLYFEVSPAPYGASEASFIGETLQRLGMRNILPASLAHFPKSILSLWCARSPTSSWWATAIWRTWCRALVGQACVPCARSVSAISKPKNLMCWCEPAPAWLRPHA
jgi:iron complex transport system substrate-binding protein